MGERHGRERAGQVTAVTRGGVQPGALHRLRATHRKGAEVGWYNVRTDFIDTHLIGCAPFKKKRVHHIYRRLYVGAGGGDRTHHPCRVQSAAQAAVQTFASLGMPRPASIVGFNLYTTCTVFMRESSRTSLPTNFVNRERKRAEGNWGRRSVVWQPWLCRQCMPDARASSKPRILPVSKLVPSNNRRNIFQFWSSFFYFLVSLKFS